VAAADELGLADEEVDPERRAPERDHGGVFGIVVDQVALDVADGTAVELDDEVVGRILAA